MCRGILCRQREHIVSGILLSMFFSMAYCQTPILDIKVNNSDGPLFFSPSDTISISVQLDPRGRFENADWFLAGNTSQGLFFFDLENWSDLVEPAVQIPLQLVPTIHLMDIPASALWPGDFSLYFGVDTLMDGAITWDQLYYDAVDFTVAGFPEDSRYIEAESGGKLTVMNGRGDLIRLDIPPDSLKKSTTVTLISRETTVPSPFATNIFSGVDLFPHGTVLKRPARLTVEFANPLSGPRMSSLFFVESSKIAIPLAYRYYEQSILEGDIKHFSTYEGAEPSKIESQGILKLIQALDGPTCGESLPINCKLGIDEIENLLNWAKLSDDLGTDLKEDYLHEAMMFANSICVDYLQSPIPLDACGYYANDFLKLREMLKVFDIQECSDTVNYFTHEDIQKRFDSLNQICGFSNDFDGIWKINLKTESKVCQYRKFTPLDCRAVWDMTKAVHHDEVYEQKMFVEISPTSYGHSIKVHPYLGSGHFNFPSNEPYPLIIEGRNFSFSFKTNSALFCEVNAEHGDCWNNVNVSGRISDDGTKLVGKAGWFEIDYGIVHTNKHCPNCQTSCLVENLTSYKMPWGCVQTGVFAGLKQ